MLTATSHGGDCKCGIGKACPAAHDDRRFGEEPVCGDRRTRRDRQNLRPRREAERRPRRSRKLAAADRFDGRGIAVLGAAVYFGIPAIYRYFRYESTDDAFVNGHVTYRQPAHRRPRDRGVGREQSIRRRRASFSRGWIAEPFQIAVDQKRAASGAGQANGRSASGGARRRHGPSEQARDQARGQLAAVYADWYLLQTVQTLIGYEAGWAEIERRELEIAAGQLGLGAGESATRARNWCRNGR